MTNIATITFFFQVNYLATTTLPFSITTSVLFCFQVNYLATTFPDKFQSLPQYCTHKIPLSVGDFDLVIHLDEKEPLSREKFNEALDPFEKLMVIFAFIISIEPVANQYKI